MRHSRPSSCRAGERRWSPDRKRCVLREKLEIGAGIVMALTALVLLGYVVYDFGSVLVELLGLFYGLSVAAGSVILCRVADRVAPRADGGSWFGVLIDFVLASDDDE